MLDYCGSVFGRWTAHLLPSVDRRVRLNLFRRDFRSRADAHAYEDVDTGLQKIVLNEERQVRISYVAIQPGAFVEEPTLIGSYEDAQDFLQAIVNEAAKLGIHAQSHNEGTAELNRTLDHLDDMRRLVFKSMSCEPVKRKP